MNNLIGISGKIKSGKDTVGKIIGCIDADYNLDETLFTSRNSRCRFPVESKFETKKFADKIKDTVCLWLGCTREQLEDHDYKNKELGKEWWYYKFYRQINDSPAQPYLVSYIGNENKKDKNGFEHPIIKLTPRKILQLLGSECGRQIIHPNIWINTTFADYKISCTEYGCNKSGLCEAPNPNKDCVNTNGEPNWIITDVRLPNEEQAIKNRGGIVIRVNRRIDLRFPKIWKEFIEEFKEDSPENIFLMWLQNHSNEKYRKLGVSLIHESETALDNYTDWDHIIDNNGTIDELVRKVKNII